MSQADAIPVASVGGKRLRTALLLLALLLLATGIRLYRIGEWSFWSDEISTLRDARNLRDVIGYPVGYFLIGLAVKALGTTEFAARILPALFGAAAVAALFLIGRRMFSARAGFLAALLLALCSFHIYYSQYARYYTMLGLFSMLGMWLAYEGFERDRRWLTAAGAALMGLACWTHWTAGLFLPSLAAYLLWSARGERPRGLNRWNLAILFGPFILGGLAFSAHFLDFFKNWGGGAFSISRAALMVLKLADRMEPAAVLCGIPAAWLFFVTDDRRGKWLLSYALVPCLILVLFVGFAHGGSRFAFAALPAFMLLAGAGLDLLIRYGRGSGRKAAWALVGLACLSLGVRTFQYFGPEQGQRPRWKEAVSFAESALTGAPTPVVYASTPSIFNHYAERYKGSLRALPLQELSVDDLENRKPDLIVIEHVDNVAPPPDLMDAIHFSYRLEAAFPLRVRFLDYSISIYARKSD
jgi:hypothetical protein